MITLLLVSAWAGTPLALEISDLSSADGTVLCTLYADEASWLQDPGYFATVATLPREDGTATCTFVDVPPGTYAITFLHDANNNGDMDNNWLGLPKEAWGVSNDAPARLGPPRFADARFLHPGTAPTARAR